MFQRLVKDRPALKEYWKVLLEKGLIEDEKGSIELISRPNGEKTLIVKDIENDILFHILSGRLEITRDASGDIPVKRSFRVSRMDEPDPANLEPTFESVEGFELALRDLYSTVDRIVEQRMKLEPPIEQVRMWLNPNGNKIFLLAALIYTILTLAALFAH